MEMVKRSSSALLHNPLHQSNPKLPLDLRRSKNKPVHTFDAFRVKMSHKNRLFSYPEDVLMNPKAFTLIELLIVVAIIAILAAIAVPNFLEAQTRSKVSRCMADMRSLATGVESYLVDHNHYPYYGRIKSDGSLQIPATDNMDAFNDQMSFIGPCITTPISYITSWFPDPFATNFVVSGAASNEIQQLIYNLEYLNLDQPVANFGSSPPAFSPQLIPAWGNWRMVGAGPDGDRGQDIKVNTPYDATNGTISDGDIVRCQRFSENRINPIAP